MKQTSLQKQHRFLTIGELLLRLTPPDHELLRAANCFEIHYGGSEANVAVSLASLGIDSTFFTVVPSHAIGKSALAALKQYGVSCKPVIFSTPTETPHHRLGTYYLENGFGPRPSQVIYDRKDSAMAEYDFSSIDLNALLDGCTWLHLSGITPALSHSCADLILRCLKAAKQKGITVSFDGNFRSQLWSWEEARDFCTACLPYIDVLFGIEPYHLWKNEKDHREGDYKDGLSLQPSMEEQKLVFDAFFQAYPNLKCIFRHVRDAKSGSQNSLKAYLGYPDRIVESRQFSFEILDRVGGGDAFAAGAIYAMMNGSSPEETIHFAVAASVLKHTIHGDVNPIDDPERIRAVMQQHFDIRR